MSKTSISDDNIYPEFCQLATNDNELFKTFRSNPKYTAILEHVSQNDGNAYLKIIKNDNPTLLLNIDKYKTNDTVGSPFTYNSDAGLLSPTTIRYVKVLSDLINQFGPLDGLDIVEIGCGYGGQSKVIMDTFKVKSYTLIDLQPVLDLTKKYLESVGVDLSNVKFITMDKLSNNEKFDLAISNYAFTECVKNVQLEYLDKVLNKSKKGYITANFINDVFNLDYLNLSELQKMLPSNKLIDEQPKTHHNNVIIVWK